MTSTTPGPGPDPEAGQFESSADETMLVEVGWILAGRFSQHELAAVEVARRRVGEFMRSGFPQFRWQMPLLGREDLVDEGRVEPTLLLDRGTSEGSMRHWDFTIVITTSDLIGHYRRVARAAVSRSLEAAVVSTSRMTSLELVDQRDPQQLVEQLGDRITQLVLHMLGHWCGLSHADKPENVMYEQRETDEPLSWRDQSFTSSQLDEMAEHLREIGDRRLEESEQYQASRSLRFYLAAVWVNRGDLCRAVWEARAWEFPLRLSRLTAAAISTALIMTMTAEVWDLGMNQSWQAVLVLSLLAIAGTTSFILKKQKLIVPRSRGLTEQSVLTNVATTLIVLLGMATTYGILFVATLGLTSLLFTPELADAWTTSLKQPVARWHYPVLAGFIAVAGIVIGALGASFEQQYYFRHITLIDEEI